MAAHGTTDLRANSAIGPIGLTIGHGAALAILAMAVFDSGFAQSDPLREKLAGATRIECRFSVLSTGTWEEGTTSATTEPIDFEASFSEIDIVGGTAQADGRVGTSYIVARHAGDYLHLIQISDIGPLYVTTVYAAEASEGRLMAIHTRHEFAASSYPEFRERPETYLGDCALGD